MLARVNRVTQPGDFRTILRRGRRVTTDNAVIMVFDRQVREPGRFGFVVAKTVGGAVTRNLVRRRLRAVCREILPIVPDGTDVVIRALPGCDRAAWATLQSEIVEGVSRRVTRG